MRDVIELRKLARPAGATQQMRKNITTDHDDDDDDGTNENEPSTTVPRSPYTAQCGTMCAVQFFFSICGGGEATSSIRISATILIIGTPTTKAYQASSQEGSILV
jgi:hypothetical protein